MVIDIVSSRFSAYIALQVVITIVVLLVSEMRYI